MRSAPKGPQPPEVQAAISILAARIIASHESVQGMGPAAFRPSTHVVRPTYLRLVAVNGNEFVGRDRVQQGDEP
jgi:hypothetical protein